MPDWNDFLELAKDGIEEVEERWDEIVGEANRMYKKWRYEVLVGKLEDRISELQEKRDNLANELHAYQGASLSYSFYAPNDTFVEKQDEVDEKVQTVLDDMDETISRLRTAKGQAQTRVHHYS